MSSVVINNKMIGNQHVRELDISKVNLPFNVSKQQVRKIIDLLSKVSIKLNVENDKLEIQDMNFNGLVIKGKREIANSNFTLSNTYVATIKTSIITKVNSFYNKIKVVSKPQRPIFNIGEETNLQQALREATAEIPLEEINKSLNSANMNNNIVNTNVEKDNQNIEQPSIQPNNFVSELNQNNTIPQNTTMPEMNNASSIQVETPKTDVVLANSPYEESNIKMNSAVLPNNNDMLLSQDSTNIQQNINNQMMQNQVNTNETQTNFQNNISNSVTNQNTNVVPQTIPLQENTPIQPNVKVKKLSGKIFTIPLVIIWLGLVLLGSIKLVTSILT